MSTKFLKTTETTFVSSAFPDTNFKTNPVIYAGTDKTFQKTISYLHYALALLPVSEIDSAILQLAVITKTGDTLTPVVVNKVSSPVDTDTVTYNTRPSLTPIDTNINISTDNLFATIRIDITELVTQWIDDASTNFGIALTSTDEATSVGFGTNVILHEPFYPILILTLKETSESPDTSAHFEHNSSKVVINDVTIDADEQITS